MIGGYYRHRYRGSYSLSFAIRIGIPRLLAHSLQPFRESADNTVSKHRFLAKSLAADCRLIVRLSLGDEALDLSRLGYLRLAASCQCWASPADIPRGLDGHASRDSALATRCREPELRVAIHGPGPPLVKKSFHDARAWDPHYVWSGLARDPWAVTLSLADGALMDLTGTATVRWRARQSGFRALRTVLELEGDLWLVSEQADGESPQWRVSEMSLSGARWRRLDIDTVTEGAWEDTPT